MKRPIFLFLVFCLAFGIYFSWVNNALADFGVFPSAISNPRLLPGSHFEQEIKLTRSESEQDLKLEITIEPSEIKNWLRIDKGNSFTIPKDKKEIYFKVLVDIPQNAETGDYPGAILIRGVSLTANISLDFKVTQEDIVELEVFSPYIPDLKQGENIKVLLDIENKGNVEGGPSRAHLDIYNLLGGNILESTDVVKLSSIKPFESKEIVAEFPTNLAAGQYRADFTIFKGREILKKKELIFGILSPEKTEKTEKKEISFPVSIQNITEFIHSYIEYFYIGLATVLIGGLIFLNRNSLGKIKIDIHFSKEKKGKFKKKKRKKVMRKIKDIKPVSKTKIVTLKKRK